MIKHLLSKKKDCKTKYEIVTIKNVIKKLKEYYENNKAKIARTCTKQT